MNDEVGQQDERQRDYWSAIDALVASSEVILDRPSCSSPVCYEDMRYPYDHGYLAATHSADHEGIDVWVGSGPDRAVTGVIATVDVRLRSTGLNVLLSCTPEDATGILAILQERDQSALLIRR